MAIDKRHELLWAGVEKHVRANEQGVDPLLHEARNRPLDIAFDNSSCDNQFSPERVRRRLHLSPDFLSIGIGRVLKHPDDGGPRDGFVQDLELLWRQRTSEEGHARKVAARTRQAGYEAEADRVSAYFENDWNRRGRLFRRARRSVADAGDHGHPAANKVGRQRRQSLVLILRPAVFKRDVLAFDVAGLCQSAPDRIDAV